MTTRGSFLAACVLILFAPGLRAESDLRQLTHWLLQDDRKLDDLPFPDVIEAATGKKILQIDETDPATRRVLQLIAQAADLTLREMNAPGSEAQQTRRINEASRYFENALREKLRAAPDLECDFPPTAAGKVQRSGYPDLRVLDRATGSVFYLDPKVYAEDSRDSSFRTFYYEPKTDTSKVLENAHHLVLGIAHDTAPEQPPHFTRWKLIDLFHLRVRLKAEFEGSNRDLYKEGAVVGAGGAVPR